MIYIILFFVGVAILVWWFCANIREVRMVEPPTLGAPHIWPHLTRRLANDLDNARWRSYEIPSVKLESES